LKTYEAVIILNNRNIEDGGEVFINEVASYLESNGGTVSHKISMGRRQFARPIKKQTAGTYWNLFFDYDPAKIDALKEHYSLDTTVTRLAVFNYDGPAISEEKTEEKA